VATSVSYIDGVTGGNVFVMTLDGARRLAAAMMGMEQPEDPDAPELSELEQLTTLDITMPRRTASPPSRRSSTSTRPPA
jgi:flagellar motor switch protein FliN/FliY